MRRVLSFPTDKPSHPRMALALSQSAQLWWPGCVAARLAGLGAARLAGPGGTDRRTDRGIG